MAPPRSAVTQTAFFLLCACLPWLNPVSGGAMTPAIPLLLGWLCIALLFVSFPAWRGAPMAVYAGVFVAVAALGSVLFDTQWQLLAVALLMIGAAAAVGAHCAQAPAADANAESGHSGIQLIAWSWLLAGLLNAGIGLLQSVQWTEWLGVLVNHAPAGQVYGNMRQRNQFASLMQIALWALWYLWHSGALQRLGQRIPGRPAAALLAWLSMLPLAVALALTLSRTGFIQLVMLVLLLLWWGWRRDPSARMAGAPGRRGLVAWLGGLVLIYAVGSYVLPGLLHGGTDILDRLEGHDSRACVSRVTLWGNVLRLIMQKPWLGWGWGELDYAHYMANYDGMRFCLMLDNAHDLPLHLAVELGVPLALLFCGIVLWWLWRNRPWSEQSPERQLMWGVLLAIGIHSLLEYPLWYSHFQLACGLALGALWTLPRQVGQVGQTGKASQQVQPVPAAGWLLGQRVLGILLVLGLLYASFDFVRVTQLYTMPEDRVWPFAQDTRQQAARTILYRNAVDFADLSTTAVTPATARQQLAQARRLMHYSPEARVVERMIECLQVLGRHDEAARVAAHFQSVYPDEYRHWVQTGTHAEEEE